MGEVILTGRFEFEGETFEFDPRFDDVLKRGIYVQYEQSTTGYEKVVLVPFIFWSARLQKVIIIPRWFLTDLASIPAMFRGLISKEGRTEWPALPHDLGYALNGSEYADQMTITKSEWDLVLRDFCHQQDMSPIKAALMYSAVAIGGCPAWRSKGPVFIPMAKRAFYAAAYPDLDLPLEDGAFLVP